MHPETKNVHAGREADPATGATQTPLHLTAAFAFPHAEEMEDVFAGRGFGYVYSRIANPTVAAFEHRLTALDGGVGTLALASGMAAISNAVLGLCSTGDNIVSSSRLFGGTWSFFQDLLPRLGIEVRFVDPTDPSAVRAAIDGRTRMLYVESLANPVVSVPDIEAWAAAGREANVPLVVDNTCMPGHLPAKKLGIALLLYSTTKWIDGHGRTLGGAIVDAGGYKWRTAPHAHLKGWIDRAGPLAFLAYLRGKLARDLGACMSPFSAYIQASGIDTLELRFERECGTALGLARFLAGRPEVGEVLYPGLESSPDHGRAAALFGGRFFGAILSFRLPGRDEAIRFLDRLRLASRMTNLGDTRTLVVHPWSTINNGYSAEENAAMGVDPGLIRVSVGLEHVDDLVADFTQAFAPTP